MRGGTFISDRKFRNLLVLLATLPLMAGLLSLTAPVASADDASNVKPAPSGEGWFWETRPQVESPVPELGDPTQEFTEQFPKDHLFVGWDAADLDDNENREYITGISFDLFSVGVPSGSVITRFELTMVEHHATDHNTQAQALAREQGIVACSWPNFFGGSHGASFQEAPESGDRRGGDCSVKVEGQPQREVDPTTPDATYPWKFNLTQMMGDLWNRGENTAVSIEPNMDEDSQSATSWSTSFHNSTYVVEDEEGNRTARPGVFATISWVPPANGSFGPAPGETTTQVSVGEPTGSTGGGSTEVISEPSGSSGVEPPAGESPTGQLLSAGAVEGPSAPFWDIPLPAWLGMLAGILVLGFAGWSLMQEPVAATRSEGAVAALMRGRSVEGS